MLFEVVRYEPKGFRVRRPDSDGGWIWNLKGTRRVLYRLPEVIGAIQAGKPIYLVEGEKDADAAVSRGLIATTNPGGAGKWRSDYSETLREATIIIVADRDTPGRKHAQSVASSLAGVASSVRIVEPAEGNDLSDHFAAGKGIDELVPVPASPVDSGIEVTQRPEIVLARPLPYRPFPVEQLPEPIRGFVVLSAESCNCDTTFVALPMLASLTRRSFRRTVLWFAWESGWYQTGLEPRLSVSPERSLGTGQDSNS